MKVNHYRKVQQKRLLHIVAVIVQKLLQTPAEQEEADGATL